MESGLTWIASYPRSGNTWLRVLLHAYLHGPPGSSRDVARTIPDLHVDGEFERTGPMVRIAKTHFPWSAAHPHAARTAGAIVVLRHPRDVLLSCLDFHRVLGTKSGAGPLRDRDFAHAFTRAMGDPVWISQGMGTWPEFNASWLDATIARRAVLRYEDMKVDPGAALAQSLQVLGEPIDPARVAAAVKAASFDSMRALEVREKAGASAKNTFFGGGPATLRKGHLFMSRARVGASLDAIAPGLDREFEGRFSEAMARFGYGPAGCRGSARR